ncbi:MAG TPA: DUF1648 domain-containing protein [Candidatus Binataceae bacterium]|nr:DUF1648 domain-containing protein [Candidatus Binataceae bacterium]
MKGYWKIASPGWLIIGAMFAIAILLWPSAPEAMPMHWNFSGEIDGYGGKFEGLFLMPIMATFIWGLMNVIAWIRSEKFNRGLRAPFFFFAYAVVLLDVGVFAVQAMHARGLMVNMNYVIWPLVVLLWVSIGNLVLSAVRLKSREGSPPQLGIPT